MFAAIAVAGLLSGSAAAQADGWIGSWGASVVFPVGPDVNFQTLRQFVRLSAGGKRLRVRFTNATGQYPLVIGAARVARPAADAAPGAIDPATDRVLTFGGAAGVTVQPGAVFVSDPVELAAPSLSTVAISVFVSRWTGPSVVHPAAGAATYISDNGDFTGAAAMPAPHASTSRFFVDEVDVEAAGQSGTVVALGDSITDGGGPRSWPNGLAERLAARSNAEPVGVVNAGIGGNRILHDHPEDLFGPSALARLDRDVLSTPGLKWVLLMEGINDIGHPTAGGLSEQDVTAGQIIAGMKQIIVRVHAHGAKIYGGTLTPYEGATIHGYYQPEGEAKREAVNDWIRNGDFDAVIDFDAALRDPEHPTRIRPEYDGGDHLHPNDAGYRAMGQAVDLRLFE